MALAFLNRCGFRATSSGTGDFVVASALTGMYAPASCANPAMVDGATYRYFAESDDKTQHEEAYGTWTSATSTLSRDTILSSSNSGSKVNFSAAPSVYMGGPLAQEMHWDLIKSYDISNNGPFANLDFDLDNSVYAGYRLACDKVLIALPGSPALNDYVIPNLRALDAGGSDLGPSQNESPTVPGGTSTYNGTNWDGTTLVSSVIDIFVTDYAADVGGNAAEVVTQDNSITALFQFRAPINQNGQLAWSNVVAKTLRFSALHWVDASSAYGTDPDYTSGYIALYGLRK